VTNSICDRPAKFQQKNFISDEVTDQKIDNDAVLGKLSLKKYFERKMKRSYAQYVWRDKPNVHASLLPYALLYELLVKIVMSILQSRNRKTSKSFELNLTLFDWFAFLKEMNFWFQLKNELFSEQIF